MNISMNIFELCLNTKYKWWNIGYDNDNETFNVVLEIVFYPAAHDEGTKPVNPAAGLQSVIVSVNVLE